MYAMETMMLITQFILGFSAILGFSIVINVPKDKLKFACLIGAISWVAFVFIRGENGENLLAGGFWASVLVGFIADGLSRGTKEAVTIYVVPGILPLVPGAGMYQTMLYFINDQLELAAETGTQTLMLAGSISLGIMTVGAMSRFVNLIRNKRKIKIKENELKTVQKWIERTKTEK